VIVPFPTVSWTWTGPHRVEAASPVTVLEPVAVPVPDVVSEPDVVSDPDVVSEPDDEPSVDVVGEDVPLLVLPCTGATAED
jgi:hypothetical protein